MKLCFGIAAENQKIFLLKILVAQIKPQKRKNEGEITKWVNLNLVCCPIKNEWIRTCRITSTPKKKKKTREKMNIQSGFTSFGLVLSSNSNASRLLNKIFAGWDRSFEKLKSRVCFLLWLKDSNFNFLWWEFLAQIWEPREPTIENPILRSSKCV